MSENADSEMIQSHWDGRASGEVPAESVTLRDLNQRHLEIDMICKYLDPRDTLLDIGCGNGYSTQIFARFVSHATGADYSEAMIARAKNEVGESSKIAFEVQDVLYLRYAPMSFDVVVVERCLINLPEWEKQQQAIKNIACVLKPGGRFIFLEGSQDGLDHLNLWRVHFGLGEIVTVYHNLNFREEPLLAALKEDFDVVAIHKFGLYDFLSRVVNPLLVRPDEPAYDALINKVAREIASEKSALDEMSRMIGIVLKKR